MTHAQLWFGAERGGDDGETPRVRRLRIVSDAVANDAQTSETATPAWLDALRAGNLEAFRALYDAHAQALWEFTAYLLRDSDAARDVVQDVFAALWERRATLDIHDAPRVYLFRAVRNQVSKRRRHADVVRRTAETAMELDTPLAMGDAAPAPDQALDAAALEQAVDAIVRAMPPARRMAATLRLRHGLSDTEAAAVMGLSVEAVRMHVSRARAALRPLVERFRES